MKTLSFMRKIISFVLAMSVVFCLASCKSQNVKDCEAAIKGLGNTVTVYSYDQIQDVRRMYSNLSSEEKEDVSNYQILVECEAAYEDAVKDKANEIRKLAHECALSLVAKNDRTAISKAREVVNILKELPSNVISSSEFSDIDDLEYWEELYQVISGTKDKDELGAVSYVMCSTVLEHALKYDV